MEAFATDSQNGVITTPNYGYTNVSPRNNDQLSEFSLNPVIKSKQVLSKRLLNYSIAAESVSKIGKNHIKWEEKA